MSYLYSSQPISHPAVEKLELCFYGIQASNSPYG